MRPRLPLLAALAAPLCLSAAAGDDAAAPTITASAWVNHVGEPPQLEHLKGRAVLVHFLSTDPDPDVQKNAHWPMVQKHWNEFRDKGVVFLGVARESESEVRRYLDEHNVPFPVAAGCDAHDVLGAGGAFYEILFDRKGERFWEGPANGLWNGKFLKGAKGSDRPGDEAPLALHVPPPYDDAVGSAVETLASGELAKGLKKLDTMLAKASYDAAAKESAQAVRDALEAHVERLLGQVERLVEDGEVQLALQPLEELAKQLKRHELGAAAVELLDAYEGDPWVQEQLEAAARYDDLMGDYWRLGFSKTEARFRKLVEEYEGTAAARKARIHLDG